MPEYRRLENGLCVATWRRWEGKGSTPAEALEGLLHAMADEIDLPRRTADQVDALRFAAALQPDQLRSMLGAR